MSPTTRPEIQFAPTARLGQCTSRRLYDRVDSGTHRRLSVLIRRTTDNFRLVRDSTTIARGAANRLRSFFLLWRANRQMAIGVQGLSAGINVTLRTPLSLASG